MKSNAFHAGCLTRQRQRCLFATRFDRVWRMAAMQVVKWSHLPVPNAEIARVANAPFPGCRNGLAAGSSVRQDLLGGVGSRRVSVCIMLVCHRPMAMLTLLMLTVVIPTLNAAAGLRQSLPALVPGTVSGLVSVLVISDGGSKDETLALAEEAGARMVEGQRGRGQQLAAGARLARTEWLLFLHADSVLAPGWEQVVEGFIRKSAGEEAACFRLRFDDRSLRASLLETVVALRSRLLALPYGDQGLLISRALYERLGGFADIPIMEDVDIIRKIGRRRLTLLSHAIVTSADRYRREGYGRRMLRNLACLSMWFAGVSPQRIAKYYG